MTPEVDHAIKIFGRIPHVFKLAGTKRFVPGDPLIEFLACMREGRPIPSPVWSAFEQTFAQDSDRRLDERHAQDRFRCGFGMAIHWETLARWIPTRARRDARTLGVPLVFLQAADECNAIDRAAAARLLCVPNLHNTGHVPGILPAHVGMRVRFTAKYNGPTPRWTGTAHEDGRGARGVLGCLEAHGAAPERRELKGCPETRRASIWRREWTGRPKTRRDLME